MNFNFLSCIRIYLHSDANASPMVKRQNILFVYSIENVAVYVNFHLTHHNNEQERLECLMFPIILFKIKINDKFLTEF
jgi:hypothetical protein